MLHCEKCGVRIGGARTRCPLCQGPLSGTPDPQGEVFPAVPDAAGRYHLLTRLLVFLSIAAAVVCITIDKLLPDVYRWPYYVVGGIACMWFCLANVIRRRDNLPKNIVWMLFWLSLLCLAWDYFTGWRQWSLNYVIPSLCVFAMLAVVVIAKVLDMHIREYMIYLILDALFGFIPALFLTLGWVRVRYPSILCVAVSALSLAALFAFEGERLMMEIRSRLHL